MTKPKPVDCRPRYWYDLKVGDVALLNGELCRVKERTLDAIWFEDLEDDEGEE